MPVAEPCELQRLFKKGEESDDDEIDYTVNISGVLNKQEHEFSLHANRTERFFRVTHFRPIEHWFLNCFRLGFYRTLVLFREPVHSSSVQTGTELIPRWR